MAFSPVDLPIQEMLQTDFIPDLSQIHNSNVLILKDKLEDLMNNFEMDINTISIGTDNAINSIKSQNVIMQDGGFIFQTGIPNQIIAKLSQNVDGLSVLNVDILTVDTSMSIDAIDANSLVINDSLNVDGNANFDGSLNYTGSIVESKESVLALCEFDGVTTGAARITLTNTSKRNIYVTLNAETNMGPTQVWSGAAINPSISDFIVYLDFDENNPPAANTTFTIYIVDVLENSGATSIISNINSGSLPTSIAAGFNASTTNDILLHNDFAGIGYKLAINYASSDLSTQALYKYGSNATFNYVIDGDLNDRLMITSKVGLEVVN